MEDPQAHKSLDELFRKTFEGLPENPAPSGWDTPSPRIWEQVRSQIKPPKSGWTTQSILLLSGLAVVLLLGLYWALSRPDQPIIKVPQPIEQPAAAAESPDDLVQLGETNHPAPETTASIVATVEMPAPSSTAEAVQPVAGQPADTKEEEEHGSVRRPAVSAPLPGSAQAPNTTIRRQMEELRRAPWAQPLEPLPSILNPQAKAVPPIQHQEKH